MTDKKVVLPKHQRNSCHLPPSVVMPSIRKLPSRLWRDEIDKRKACVALEVIANSSLTWYYMVQNISGCTGNQDLQHQRQSCWLNSSAQVQWMLEAKQHWSWSPHLKKHGLQATFAWPSSTSSWCKLASTCQGQGLQRRWLDGGPWGIPNTAKQQKVIVPPVWPFLQKHFLHSQLFLNHFWRSWPGLSRSMPMIWVLCVADRNVAHHQPQASQLHCQFATLLRPLVNSVSFCGRHHAQFAPLNPENHHESKSNPRKWGKYSNYMASVASVASVHWETSLHRNCPIDRQTAFQSWRSPWDQKEVQWDPPVRMTSSLCDTNIHITCIQVSISSYVSWVFFWSRSKAKPFKVFIAKISLWNMIHLAPACCWPANLWQVARGPECCAPALAVLAVCRYPLYG